ncbi:hypothetical protein DL98DRAFT_565716 [Cadophora sp. DSE1049]|nr:hypothetical protein DL98DRAFT_565716 [Cadophora sp. DSE1049]
MRNVKLKLISEMEEPLSRSLLTSISSAGAPELKDVLRRIESRARSTHQHQISKKINARVEPSGVSDLAALVKEASALDGRCIAIVQEVFRANEKEKSHLRKILLGSNNDDEEVGVERVELVVSAALKKKNRTSTPPPPSSSKVLKRSCIKPNPQIYNDPRPSKVNKIEHGALRQYQNKSQPMTRWMCCGKDSRLPGCSKSPHLDDSLPSEVMKLSERREAAQQLTNAVLFRSCTRCHQDSVIDSAPLTSSQSSPSRARTAVTVAELKCSSCRVLEQMLSERQTAIAKACSATGDSTSPSSQTEHQSMAGSRPVLIDLMEESDSNSDSDTAAVTSNQGQSRPGPIILDLMDDSDSDNDPDSKSESDSDSSNIAGTDDDTAFLRNAGPVHSWCNQCLEVFHRPGLFLVGWFDTNIELCLECQREENSIVDSLGPSWLSCAAWEKRWRLFVCMNMCIECVGGGTCGKLLLEGPYNDLVYGTDCVYCMTT